MKGIIATTAFWVPEGCTESGLCGRNPWVALNVVLQASPYRMLNRSEHFE